MKNVKRTRKTFDKIRERKWTTNGRIQQKSKSKTYHEYEKEKFVTVRPKDK